MDVNRNFKPGGASALKARRNAALTVTRLTDSDCRNLASVDRTQIAILPHVTAGSAADSEIAGISQGSGVIYKEMIYVAN